jgi:hypothetical protein
VAWPSCDGDEDVAVIEFFVFEEREATSARRAGPPAQVGA